MRYMVLVFAFLISACDGGQLKYTDEPNDCARISFVLKSDKTFVFEFESLFDIEYKVVAHGTWQYVDSSVQFTIKEPVSGVSYLDIFEPDDFKKIGVFTYRFDPRQETLIIWRTLCSRKT